MENRRMAVQDRLSWPGCVIKKLSKLTFCNSYLRLNLKCPSKFFWLISSKAVTIMYILYVCKTIQTFGKCWYILQGSSLSTPKFIWFCHHTSWKLVVLEDTNHALYINKKYDHPVAFESIPTRRLESAWLLCSKGEMGTKLPYMFHFCALCWRFYNGYWTT